MARKHNHRVMLDETMWLRLINYIGQQTTYMTPSQAARQILDDALPKTGGRK